MRLPAMGVVAVLALAVCGCSSGPAADIIAPLEGSTVSASIELRLEGHELGSTMTTEVLVDGQHYSDLIESTLPANCDSCKFTISFAGASIANGTHRIGVNLIDDNGPIASDQVTLMFLR